MSTSRIKNLINDLEQRAERQEREARQVTDLIAHVRDLEAENRSLRERLEIATNCKVRP